MCVKYFLLALPDSHSTALCNYNQIFPSRQTGLRFNLELVLVTDLALQSGLGILYFLYIIRMCKCHMSFKSDIQYMSQTVTQKVVQRTFLNIANFATVQILPSAKNYSVMAFPRTRSLRGQLQNTASGLLLQEEPCVLDEGFL